jgi:hypothetical protein
MMPHCNRVVIIPYLLGSNSAKGLQTALQGLLNVPVLRVSKYSKKYQPRYTDYVINWGCSNPWDFITLDKKDGHKQAVNKLQFFQTAQGKVNIPEWTTSQQQAQAWSAAGKTVIGRKILNGNSGKGIVVYEPNTTVGECPLYTLYKKKRHEFRVHVFKGNVIDVAQKKKKKGYENVDSKIRNHKTGWVFCRENIIEPAGLRTQAIQALAACGLPFGAVDIIWNEAEDKCYVLEINTAPGIEGSTLQYYTNAFFKDITK